MAFLQDKDKEYIRNMFSSLSNKVKITFFTQEIGCQYCGDTLQILDETSDLSDKIELDVKYFSKDKNEVEKYKIDKTPAIVIEGEKDYGIRFYGIPSGYEYSSLLDDIVDISKGESGLTPQSKEMLKKIEKQIHLQVFVTPTCPHCPRAVKLSHKMAIENEQIVSDMIEATEFPELSMRYGVRGVPRTMIGEDFSIEGAVPEDHMIQKVLSAYHEYYSH